jgi:two-component system NtrC family sensor kinase
MKKRADDAAARLAAIVESSDDAIMSKSLDGTIRSWNRAAERLFGFTAAEAVGRSIMLIIPPEGEDEERQALARVRAGEMIDHFETLRRRKDGALVRVWVTISPVRDRRGRITGASTIARAAGERARLDEALARLAAIVDSSDDAIVSKTLEGVITSWNRGAQRLFGYSAAEAVGQPIFLIIPSDRRAEEEGRARAHPRRRDRRSLRDGATPEGRHARRDLAHGLAAEGLPRAGDRRLEDRP